MAFLLEKNMVPIIQKNIQTLLNDIEISQEKDSLLLAYEVPVHYRMIDVAIALIEKDNLHNFEQSQQYKQLRNLNSRVMDVLSLLYANKKMTVFTIKKEIGLEYNEIKKHLLKLVKLELAEQLSKYTFTITDWTDILPQSIVSIELKLSRWQEALDQGIYNLRFSDFSFVALDEERIPISKDIERHFKENNVGLIYVNSNGNVRPAFVPRENNMLDLYMKSFQQIKVCKDIINRNNKWSLISEVE